MKRTPAVAGQFYYADEARLAQQIESCIDKSSVKEDVIGIMVPHAGLIYSGPVAGAVYSGIKFPKTFILIGPNHTGIGAPISLMDSGEWEIPTGRFQIDRKLAARILVNSGKITADSQGHMFEHSLEVQLPFLAYFSRAVKIVPISMLSASLEDCLEVAAAIAKSVKETEYSVVIGASSDMSHYLPDKVARQKDRLAIDTILDMDPAGLWETVRRERISMCGYMPATVMLAAAKLLGAGSARLVKYATSGEVSGDYEAVVGYAGVVVR